MLPTVAASLLVLSSSRNTGLNLAHLLLLCVQKVERLQQSLHFIGAPTQSKHMVFVDDESSLRGFSAEEHFQTPAELLPRAFNRPRREQLERETPVPASQDALHSQEKQDK